MHERTSTDTCTPVNYLSDLCQYMESSIHKAWRGSVVFRHVSLASSCTTEEISFLQAHRSLTSWDELHRLTDAHLSLWLTFYGLEGFPPDASRSLKLRSLMSALGGSDLVQKSMSGL